MEEYIKMSLKEEIEKESNNIEEKIMNDDTLTDIEVSPEFDSKFEKMIHNYDKIHSSQLSEEDIEALELGRNLMKRKKESSDLLEIHEEYRKHLQCNKTMPKTRVSWIKKVLHKLLH